MKKVIKVGYIEKLSSLDKEIRIEDAGIKITEDSLMLASFIKEIMNNRKKSGKNDVQTFKTMLEIGAGQGIISILLSGQEEIGKIYSVELQQKVYNILKENIEKNLLEEKIVPIHENIKNIKGEYDYIFSNPPYRKMTSGKLPDEEEEVISKYEAALTLEELFQNVRRLLKNHGEFFIIVPNDRLNDSFSYIYGNRMNILSLKIRKYRKKDLVIIHGKKGGKLNTEIKIYI